MSHPPPPPFEPLTAPYDDPDTMRLCMDPDQWQIWVWDGRTRCRDGHPQMEEVAGEGSWCAQYVDESYGPLCWFRLEACDAPLGPPSSGPAVGDHSPAA